MITSSCEVTLSSRILTSLAKSNRLQEFGQTECTPCPLGTFGRDSGADTCEVCPQGTFQDQVSLEVNILP